MIFHVTAAMLAALSCALGFWQWLAAKRFPIHQRVASRQDQPAITVLKPLKGCDTQTAACLESWFNQHYSGPVQILFGVASGEDPVCAVVRSLIGAHPQTKADLVICTAQLGPNAKVSTLVQLQARAAHDLIVISDADVWAPADLLANIVAPFSMPETGLVNCFYRLADPVTAAMRWEAVAVNADFWSQVLQAQTLKPLDFALGAVMATTRQRLERIGGFAALVEYLADDYQLGSKIAQNGGRIVLSPVVVECRSHAMGWQEAWSHQLRWARTIRVCQPVPFFFSILSNATLWPLVWLAVDRTALTLGGAVILWTARVVTAHSNQRRLNDCPLPWWNGGMVLLKDLLAAILWAVSFAGNRIHWRGRRYQVRSDGRLAELPCT